MSGEEDLGKEEFSKFKELKSVPRVRKRRERGRERDLYKVGEADRNSII